jgi:tetratricopeptide (TPR) repeat protein
MQDLSRFPHSGENRHELSRSCSEPMNSDPKGSTWQWTAVCAVLALFVVQSTVGRGAFGDTIDKKDPQRETAYWQAYLTEAKRELQRGNYLRAIRLLSATIQKGGGTEAYKWRGHAYDMSGDSERAMADFNYYISTNPTDPAGYCLRGDAANAELDHGAALRDFHKAVELAPSSAEPYVGRGLAYLGLEQYQLAAQDLDKALTYDPGRADALINLGVANMMAQRPNRARQLFEAALEIETDPRWKAKLHTWISALPTTSDADFARPLPVNKEDLEESSPPLKQTAPRANQRTNRTHPATRGILPPGLGRSDRVPDWNSLSGTWHATYMGVQITLEASCSGSAVSGVMRINGLGGKTDVYHFTGTVDYEGNIRATHHSGHSFQGRLAEGRRLVGVLNTRFGKTIPVDLAPH